MFEVSIDDLLLNIDDIGEYVDEVLFFIVSDIQLYQGQYSVFLNWSCLCGIVFYVSICYFSKVKFGVVIIVIVLMKLNLVI